MRRIDRVGWLAALAATLMAGCSFGPPADFDAAAIPDAVPQPVEHGSSGQTESYVVLGKRYTVLTTSRGYDERGIASWYGTGFDGRPTASGEIYDMYGMTAAHKTLPLPTYARVTNLDTDKSIVVKINDRGPFHENRIIDLSYAAAAKLGMLKNGTALVDVKAISVDTPPTPAEVVKSEPDPKSQLSRPPIYVQVGAFENKRNARRLEAKLMLSSIENVLIQPTTSANSRLYRVRIGPLPNVDAVDQLTAKLHELDIKNTQVVIP